MSKDLSDSWTGFTQFTLLKEKPPDGYMWSRSRLTKRQTTSRPYHFRPEISRSMSRNSKTKDKQKLAASEKPKLENARRLRGIYFIEPEDEEFKEIIKSSWRQLEVPAAPAVPRKRMSGRKYRATRSKNDDHKSKFACIFEAEESKRMRMEGIVPRIHEDHIAGRGSHFLQHYNLAHKLPPMPQAMKIPEAKAAAHKEWEKREKIPAWNLAKVRNKSHVIDEARKKDVKVHFASLMGLCHLKNAD